MKENSIERSNVIKEKELKRLYKSRDIEISNLWQRSVFLSVFLVLCFTGYGYLLMKMVESLPEDYETIKNVFSVFVVYNIIAIVLALVSVVFSVLWICMSKASKAWYEVYETAIKSFERDFKDQLGLDQNYLMGKRGLPSFQKNNCLFSGKSGAYSPSRINIAIGQVSLIIWIIVVIVHAILICMFYSKLAWLSILSVVLCFIFMNISVCSKWIKSGILSKDTDADGCLADEKEK